MSFVIDGIITKIFPEIISANQPCMQRHLYEHYSSVGHCGFLEHVSIILIDETDPSDSLKREEHWRRTMALHYGTI